MDRGTEEGPTEKEGRNPHDEGEDEEPSRELELGEVAADAYCSGRNQARG